MADSIQNSLQPVARFLEQIVGNELKSQGHVLTGRLKKSINVSVIHFISKGFVELEGTFLNYGEFVERGVKAKNIPYTEGSGRKKSKYIAGLVDFVIKRRIATGKKALGIAFAIAKKHKKEGMPTKGSRKFSTTGKRRGFVAFSLQRNEAKIESMIAEAFESAVEIAIDNTILLRNQPK